MRVTVALMLTLLPFTASAQPANRPAASDAAAPPPAPAVPPQTNQTPGTPAPPEQVTPQGVGDGERPHDSTSTSNGPDHGQTPDSGK